MTLALALAVLMTSHDAAPTGVNDLLVEFARADAEHHERGGPEPARRFWSRFIDRAQAGEDASGALVWLLSHHVQAEVSVDDLQRDVPSWATRLVSDHPDAARGEQSLLAMVDVRWMLVGQPAGEAVDRFLAGLDPEGLDPDARAALAFARASEPLNTRGPGRALLQGVVRELGAILDAYPATLAGRRAGRAASFTLERLYRGDPLTEQDEPAAYAAYRERFESFSARRVGHARSWLYRHAADDRVAPREVRTRRLALLREMCRDTPEDPWLVYQVLPEFESFVAVYGCDVVGALVELLLSHAPDAETVRLPARYYWAVGCLAQEADHTGALDVLRELARDFPEHELGREASELIAQR